MSHQYRASLLFFESVCVGVCVTEAGSHYVAKTGLELMILLPLPPECWDYWCAALCLARSLTLYKRYLMEVLGSFY
jgi:hypothetical protein